uniref:Uncharacterized protein n=1 Tax=Rhizophora mucronata TaxID=61149 RepID=A0A2P2N286_RHIMU
MQTLCHISFQGLILKTFKRQKYLHQQNKKKIKFLNRGIVQISWNKLYLYIPSPPNQKKRHSNIYLKA